MKTSAPTDPAAPATAPQTPNWPPEARPWGALLLALLQGALYIGGAVVFRERWIGDTLTLAVAALGQGVAIVGLWGAQPRRVAVGGLLSLLALGSAWVRLGLTIAHIHTVFGPEPAEQALQPLVGSIVLLPWLVAVPVSQLTRIRRGPLPGLLVGAFFGGGALVESYTPVAPAGDPEVALAAARALWRGAPSAEFPPVPARIRVSALALGRAEPVWVAGDDLETVRRAVAGRPPADALVVDVSVGALPEGLLRAGSDAPADTLVSPVFAARDLLRREILPGVHLPAARGDTLRWVSALVSADGVTPLVEGWAPPPPLTTEAIDEAVAQGVRHLVTNQRADGRYTYIVSGPGGDPGSGYNYPRAAGATWFLARAAAALDDPTAADGADLALAALAQQTRETRDGRRYVIDPARRDGKAWIGTTALVSMALATRLETTGAVAPPDPDATRAQLAGQVAQLAASVGADGQVRGDMNVEDSTFPDQAANPYGQGQVILALAVAERAGVVPEGKERRGALDRAVRWLDAGAYGAAHPLYVADEHWICLAAHAFATVRPAAQGASAAIGARGICATYVAQDRFSAPGDGAPRPAAGPAGGAAEAVVAHAWDTRADDVPDQALLDRAHAYGALFLRNQYRPAEALLLGRPATLLGGFRDGAARLDVQVDAVQHIGCALLGIEALLSGRVRPGSLP